MVEFAKKLTKTDASGNVTQWGVKIPSSGFPYWLFQGLTTPNDAMLMNEAGTETYFDKPAVIEALQYWVDLSAKHKVMPGGVIEWGTTPKDFFEKKAAMIWTTTGNLTNIRTNAELPVRRRDAAGEEAPGQPDRRRQLLRLRQDDAGRAGRRRCKFIKWVDGAAARRAVEHRHRLRRGDAGRLGHAGDEEVRAGRAAGAGRARPAPVLASPSSRPTTTSASRRRSTTACRRRSPASKPPADAMRDAQREATRTR